MLMAMLCRFNFYMYKKGHTGMIKVKRATEEKPGTLEIKVRIGGHGANTGNVKDLKQLSGDSRVSPVNVVAQVVVLLQAHGGASWSQPALSVGV